MKKVLSVVLALCMMLTLLAACGNDTSTGNENTTPAPNAGGESAAPDNEGPAPAVTASDETLTLALDGEPNCLLPNYQTNKVCARVNACMFDTLVRWDDAASAPVPALATEWTWDDDTHITFTLRDDVVFSNGETMTANDVLESFRMSTTQTVASFAAMVNIDDSAVIDDTHVQIALNETYTNFVDVLADTYFAVFSAKGLADAGNDLDAYGRNPVGSGPYILSDWKAGESITLVRNENYWDTEHVAYYQTMVFSVIADAASRVTALQSGSAQVAFNVGAAQLPAMEADSSITISPYLQKVVDLLCFETVNYPVLQDENVRRAIILAIDKDAYSATKNLAYGAASHSSLLATSSPYYSDCDGGQDIDTAKRLIAESGHTPEELTFTMYGISGDSTAHMELLQAELKEIGVTIKIETLDLPSFFAVCDAHGVAINIAEGNCWDSTAMTECADSRVFTPNINFTYHGDNAEELHALIDAAKAATDESEKVKLYTQVQQFLVDNAACTALCDTMFADAWSANLTGMTYDVRGWPEVAFIRPAA